MTKNIYAALNQKLLDEIPKLCDFACKILETCLADLVQFQIRFLRESVEMLQESFKLCRSINTSIEELEKMQILKCYNLARDQVLLQMQAFAIIPNSFAYRISMNPKASNVMYDLISPIHRQGSSQHLLSLRKRLYENYAPADLYVVVVDYCSQNKSELTCSREQILGVIKRQDSAGNKNVWFCDDGAIRGYIPCNLLKSYTMWNPTYARTRGNNILPYYASYQPITAPQSSPSTQTPHPSSPYSLESCDEIPANSFNDIYQDEEEMLDDSEYEVFRGASASSKVYHYVVEFTFNARSPLELSVSKGEFVNVIMQHDRSGNTDWWLIVNKHGKQGFIPNNFIRKV